MLEKKVIVFNRSGSKISGVLAGFDEYYNIYLLDYEELTYVEDASIRGLESSHMHRPAYAMTKNSASDLWIRGDTVVFIGVK